MRLLELDIENIRGIPKLSLKPNGKSFAIWGPNGSGKSAVVDAIDFLLTGSVSRLTGEGTAGITLTKYGPHIDHMPADARVRALVQFPDVRRPVELRRCIAHPGTLECDAGSEPSIGPIIALAQHGQFVLTRREILKYITADAGTRAQEIQDLLSLTEIEEIRKSFVKTQNDLDKERQAAKRQVDVSRGAINATVQARLYREDVVLQVANENRGLLAGQPIMVLRSANLKTDLKPPTIVSHDGAINIAILEKDVQNLTRLALAENRAQIARSDEELRRLATVIESDPHLLHALERVELIETGLALIDETGRCPLCDTDWPPGALRAYLERQRATAQVAAQYRDQITKLSDAVAGFVDVAVSSLGEVIEATQLGTLSDDTVSLRSWLDDLKILSNALDAPVGRYLELPFAGDEIQVLLAPPDVHQALSRVLATVRATCPGPTPDQTAWDTLTRLEENLKAIEIAEDNFKLAELVHAKACAMLTCFQCARDAVLGDLYEQIKLRFEKLYRQLHGSDEAKFEAKIEPNGAGLNFEVDFYGRGTHPPHALHSEGHQDSMGICLYLTLAEKLNGGLINLVVLDDVVMSVDADHRRKLCEVLRSSFPDRQFLITTHDRTWANQLKSEGVVSGQQTWEFGNWSVDYGPEVSCVKDVIWERIEEALRERKVPTAAACLRRGSEEFFGMVCDALQAPVTYHLGGNWEFGELLLSATKTYGKLLDTAIDVANSWGKTQESDKLRELDSRRKEVYRHAFGEQWAVDPSVHYNEWIELSEQDFRPVVLAFHNLVDLFVCSQCGAVLRVATSNRKPVCVRCQCENVAWNLEKKPGS
jgi:hypothetical protein